MTDKYSALFEPEPEGGYTVTFPEIGIGATYGATMEEAVARAEDMLDEAILGMMAHGEEIPPPALPAAEGIRAEIGVPALTAAKQARASCGNRPRRCDPVMPGDRAGSAGMSEGKDRECCRTAAILKVQGQKREP